VYQRWIAGIREEDRPPPVVREGGFQGPVKVVSSGGPAAGSLVRAGGGPVIGFHSPCAMPVTAQDTQNPSRPLATKIYFFCPKRWFAARS